MVYLKDFLYSISFPIRYWIERYKDWKEERKYLRDKWGMQGKELQLDSEESGDQESKPENAKES